MSWVRDVCVCVCVCTCVIFWFICLENRYLVLAQCTYVVLDEVSVPWCMNIIISLVHEYNYLPRLIG